MPTGNPTALILQSIVTIQPWKLPGFAKNQNASVLLQYSKQDNSTTAAPALARQVQLARRKQQNNM